MNVIEKKELISGVVLIAFSLCALWQLKDLPFRAAIFPAVMLTGMGILSIILILKSFKKEKIDKPKPAATEAGNDEIEERISHGETINNKIILTTLSIIGLYVLFMPILGFFLATIFFIFIFLRVLNLRRYVLLVCMALSTSAIVFIIFKTVMYISLPSGIFDPTKYLYMMLGS